MGEQIKWAGDVVQCQDPRFNPPYYENNNNNNKGDMSGSKTIGFK